MIVTKAARGDLYSMILRVSWDFLRVKRGKMGSPIALEKGRVGY
jgi:hypothetical protein